MQKFRTIVIHFSGWYVKHLEPGNLLQNLMLSNISGDGKRKGRSRKWKSLMKFADAAEVQIYKKEFPGMVIIPLLLELDDLACRSNMRGCVLCPVTCRG